MTTTHAININEATLPLITMINGGIKPSRIAFGDYYVFEINSDEPTVTTNHKIVGLDEHRQFMRRASSFQVAHHTA